MIAPSRAAPAWAASTVSPTPAMDCQNGGGIWLDVVGKPYVDVPDLLSERDLAHPQGRLGQPVRVLELPSQKGSSLKRRAGLGHVASPPLGIPQSEQ